MTASGTKNIHAVTYLGVEFYLPIANLVKGWLAGHNDLQEIKKREGGHTWWGEANAGSKTTPRSRIGGIGPETVIVKRDGVRHLRGVGRQVRGYE